MLELIAPFTRLLAEHGAPADIRRIEQGGPWQPAWSALEESGFLDAMVPEHAGGFGLTLTDIAPLIAAVGASAIPLPIVETMAVRSILATAGLAVPEGPAVFATGSAPTSLAGLARHAVTGATEAPVMLTLPASETFSLDRIVPPQGGGFRAIAAVLRAQLIAGAAGRVLDLCVGYANDRYQFGKPIGRQQAVQQQLAILAEQVVAARIGAGAALHHGLAPDLRAAAIAKISANIAAEQVASIAHAVHGAIGISEEFELQLLTRRLHAWRLADGSQRHWAREWGAAILNPSPISLSSIITG